MIASITSFDSMIELWFFGFRNPLLARVFEFITFFGNAFAISVVAIAIAVILVQYRHREYLTGLFVVVCGSLLATQILKLIVLRDRPLYPIAMYDVSGYSFPSMHAAMSMALYGYLAYLIYKLVHPPHHRTPSIVLLFCLIGLIGVSRLYLGVHYFSDVVAGYAIGGLFVWIGIKTVRKIRRRQARSSKAPFVSRRRSRLV